MAIDLPKHHNLKNCSNLSETGNYLRTWEISVTTTDSLEWSVVLSHLMSANLQNDEDFRNRLFDLTGESERVDTLQIKECINRFNPFLNRYSCFYNESLLKVVSDFKERLKGIGNQDSDNQNDKLEESSKSLKTYILLVVMTETGDMEIIDSFPKNDQIPSCSPRMTLYFHDKRCHEGCSYNFGLKRERGNQLKRAAFSRIMKDANVSEKKRKALLSLDGEGESFVISVLKSEYKSSILHLYKSPYLAFKLSEAGYETDPRETDSEGFSALYHSLVTEDETLVYVLYNYAANACHKSDKTFREPDKFIMDNMIRLGKILERDKKRSNDFQALNENANRVKLISDQLIRFNDFLSQMCKVILEKQKACNNISPRNISETIARKNVIMALLKTYDSFFFFEKEQVSTDYFFKLNDYCTYNTYYINLDCAATLFFFDHIFSLKERLKLNNNEYSVLESNFFLSVLSSKYFICELLKPSFSLHRNSLYDKSVKVYRSSVQKSKDLRIIPLIERLQLREEIGRFQKTLSAVAVDKNNILTKLPEDEIPKILASVPEVKDEIEIHRLMHYLDTAVKKGNVQGPKHILVIERALQVLGEFIVNGRKNPKSLCFLLSLCLPEETIKIIKRTRNILSHLEETGFEPKFKAEGNISLFRGVQKDISRFYTIFQSIFDMQQLRLAEFLFKKGLLEIVKRTPFAMPEHVEALSRLRQEYNVLCEVKSKPCYNNKIFKNLDFLENICRITEERIKFTNEESSPEYIEDTLWPLRYLVTLISESCQDLNFKGIQEIIKNSHEFINCRPNKKREKMEQFWRHYKIFISELRMKAGNSTENLNAEKSIAITIEQFQKISKGFQNLSDKDKNVIMSKIPQTVYDSIRLTQEIQNTLKSRTQLTFEQIKNFPFVFISKKSLEKLKKIYKTDTDKALEIINTASDPVRELNAILDGDSTPMKKDAFIQLCDRLELPEDVRKTLQKLNLGQKAIAPENDLGNMLNRVRLLREILIEENPIIFELWNKAKNTKTQQFAKHKIVQRYVRDPEVQASVETLLFDCMTLLGNESGMERLWIKASSLFSGINLRNVIGHGNPTLETMGKLLDPDDLPSVLIGEMLQLIRDEVIMQAMYDLCLKTNSDFDKFQEIMNDEDTEHVEICNKIRQCERWKRYSKLLPRHIEKKPCFRI